MTEDIKNKKTNPGFFFLSLGVIVTLIASVASTLSLLFAVLDKRLPDILTSTYTYGYEAVSADNIRNSLAVLVIVFPVFLILTYYWRKRIKQNAHDRESWILKWTIYIILFLSSVVIVVDLVTLVNYFLSGEITNRFIYKVLGTAIVAMLTLLYYYLNLKIFESVDFKKYEKRPNPLTGIAITSTVLFIALIVWTFQVIGSPKMQREYRLDERRVSDLQNIQWRVINYWQSKSILPENLSDLNDPIANFTIPNDPEVQLGKKYKYAKVDKLSFKLCADFVQASPEGLVESMTSPIKYTSQSSRDISEPIKIGGQNESWKHAAGEQCFTRTIDPEIYKPIQK